MADPSAASAGPSRWSRLPAVLLAHCLSFALDTGTLLATQSTCSAWRLNDKLEPLWKALYLKEFEAESAADELIAVDGVSTLWQKKFARRQLVESNWKNFRFEKRAAESSVTGVDIISRFNWLVCDVDHDLVIIDAKDSKELRRWRLSGSVTCSDCLRIDEAQSPVRLATGTDDGLVQVWNAETGEQIGKTIIREHVWHVELSGDLVLASASVDPLRLVRVWSVTTGELKFQLPHPGSCYRAFFIDNCTRLFTEAAGAVHRWRLADSELEDSSDIRGVSFFDRRGDRLVIVDDFQQRYWPAPGSDSEHADNSELRAHLNQSRVWLKLLRCGRYVLRFANTNKMVSVDMKTRAVTSHEIESLTNTGATNWRFLTLLNSRELSIYDFAAPLRKTLQVSDLFDV